MDLHDDAAQAEFRRGLRAFLAERLPETDPRGWSKALSEAGYAGLTWPVEHGGRGLPATYQAIYAEESAQAGAPDHVNVIGLNMVGPTITRYGSPAQKAAYLARILSGEAIFCQGFSEPDAGSDLAAIRTRAEAVPGGYLLNGQKVWSSYAHLADYCLLLARTDPSAVKHQGLTCFLVDMRAPGVRVAPLRQISGDSDFNEIVLTDVRVGDGDVLGAPGDGWRVALTTLAHERGTFGITLTARLAVQFERLVATVHARGATSNPVVREAVADLFVRLEALRYTGYRALSALVRTGEPGPESSVLKLEWSLANQRLAALALALAPTDAHWRQLRLRSRANSIEGGTSEILRGIIAERVLGLPRTR
jgi:alkylation response protein AidB-like acyl-CoA dehydrogenase